MSRTELLMSLSNLLLPSLPYLSNSGVILDSAFPHTCFQTLSESYQFYLQMYLGSDHCLPPPSPPLWSELPSFLTWMMAIVFCFPCLYHCLTYRSFFYRVARVMPLKPKSEQASPLLQTLQWSPSVSK